VGGAAGGDLAAGWGGGQGRRVRISGFPGAELQWAAAIEKEVGGSGDGGSSGGGGDGAGALPARRSGR
jgi:hypothetical protein